MVGDGSSARAADKSKNIIIDLPNDTSSHRFRICYRLSLLFPSRNHMDRNRKRDMA
tara:strand:+ start:2751 stop:2918 length:168 start_codon:yes stop_codon:yes gene_type:complete